jgi:hypothetical protein
MPMFQRNTVSIFKAGVAMWESGSLRFPAMLASSYKSTWRQNPEHHHHPHCYENLKSDTNVFDYDIS